MNNQNYIIIALVLIAVLLLGLGGYWWLNSNKKIEGLEAADNLQSVVNYIQTNLVPKGMIVAYNGTTPPPGWAICNGSNGTPDLRDRFIVGAGNSMRHKTAGGTNSQSIRLDVANLPAHSHSLCDDYFAETSNKIGDKTAPGTKVSLGGDRYRGGGSSDGDNSIWCKDKNTNNTGSGSPVNFDKRPAYMAVTFIMKL